MKIVIAPDSFKETLTAFEVASAIQSGFQNVFPEAEIIKIPIADGGEGTVDAMVRSCLLYTSPSPRDRTRSRMPSSA